MEEIGANKIFRRSTTYDQFRDALRDLETTSPSEGAYPQGKPLSRLFMRYWDPNDAAAAMSYLKFMEIRTKLRSLQQTHGRWHPPPEVAKYLKKRPKPMKFSVEKDTQEARDLKLVLHTLGVSPHDSKPFKQFLKAKTIRQKRCWLFKHLGAIQEPGDAYREPICETRLKRLYYFFPGRFKVEDGKIYFNDKLLLYERNSNLFHFRTCPADHQHENVSIESSKHDDRISWTSQGSWKSD